MTNGVRGRGPRSSGGTAGGAAPYASGTAPDSARSPFAGLVRFGTAPGPTVSLFRGLPKPHDARSVSPDVALRTPPRPGRAPHELVRAARASHRIAGCGLRHGKLPGPARETEAQVDRGSYIVSNPRGVRGTGICALIWVALAKVPGRPGGSITIVTPGRSGRRGGVFLRKGLHPARRVVGFECRPEPRA